MTKLCPKCLLIKEEGSYGRRSGAMAHHLRSWCRVCEGIRAKGTRKTEEQKRQKIRLSRYQRSYWTDEAFQAAFKKQGGRCNICDCVLTELRKEGTNTVHADHHPEKNTPRALLCRMCNAGLGLFRDRANLLRKAAEYLDYHNQ